MRILHISTRLILGGSQENTVLSCEGQARMGHEVHLAFGPIYGPEGSLLSRVEAFNAACAAGRERTPSGVAVRPISTHVVGSLVREINPPKDARARRELRALIASLAPDVVHTHSSKAGILGREAAWAVRPRPGVVHTIHGPPFMPMDGRVIRRAKVAALNLAYTLAERRAARRCHVIVSVADAMTRLFLAKGIGRPEQYVTVHSGMEVESLLHAAPSEDRDSMRARLGFAPSDVVVGTVARLAEHKGHDDLLDSLADDLRSRPNLRLLWVGDGWWRARLVARARGLGLIVAERDKPELGRSEGHERGAATPPGPAHVVITGLVPPERVPGMLRAMDILAHPSYREGLPRTVPQALLAGVPPVAYDADGTGEACVDGETGRLVRVGDRAGLRSALLELADDPLQRRTLAERGRERCREVFSAASMVERLETVYSRAVALARQRGGK
ncbi:MAG: glycosyltransferase [Phycisphaerae bacterium]|nr:glycosyltransferase [Phycisphaerae bacterium]